jgi:hypothetical protein
MNTDLDPHQDTPVEVLHVVLLGYVKYFWRDLVQNQLKNQDDLKELLVQRLNSFNTSGLGISPLAGQTLVQYSGSLTGRDFRAIAQVAPFVIYDLVSDECLAAWVSLSKLVPLIYMPSIDNVEEYCTILECEIRQFLLRTASWTNRWFNKPKFHVILHLPSHVRRFGPAILYATETFESFNAVIRAKSVHSNRQAPSRDIALAFAQGNRIRHLMSGGLYLSVAFIKSWSEKSPASTDRLFSSNRGDWESFGTGPLSLVLNSPIVRSYLGMVSTTSRVRSLHPTGTVSYDKRDGPIPFGSTAAAEYFPSTAIGLPSSTGLCRDGKSIIVGNEEKCAVGTCVVIEKDGLRFVGRVVEILVPRTGFASTGFVLVQCMDTTQVAPGYEMPRVKPISMYDLVDATVCPNHSALGSSLWTKTLIQSLSDHPVYPQYTTQLQFIWLHSLWHAQSPFGAPGDGRDIVGTPASSLPRRLCR